jgi:uncharacterized protein (DUF342 family)
VNLPGISLVETDGQVFLRGQAHPERPAVDDPTLRALLAEAGFGGHAVDEESFATAIAFCNERHDSFMVPIAQLAEAVVEVHVAADEMSATVSILTTVGCAKTNPTDLQRALTAAGVIFGIDPSALQNACAQTTCSQWLVARGVTPVAGKDCVFEELVQQSSDRAPKLDENGLIDYREHGDIAVVHAGTALMRRHPATKGIDGQTVIARLLPATAGKDEPFASPLPGTQADAQDPNLLRAAGSGQPVRVPNGFTVEPILVLKEVNMSSGNIHFDGTVHIMGDVVQGMKVQASGDIVVAGMVDGGVLEAGGNISVAGGVISHAKVRANGSVSARFAQDVSIQADTVINLADMALECQLVSLNHIVIGAKAPERARLIGGSITAMMLLRVPILGSSKGGLTKIMLGTNSKLTAQYHALQERISKEKEAEEHLEKLVKQLTATGDPKGMLARVKTSQQHALQVWGQSLAEERELKAQIAHGLSARLEVTKQVGGSVDMLIGAHTARLRQEYGAGTFALDADAHVVFRDAAGKTRLAT